MLAPEEIVSAFSPITLQEMKGVKLLNRIDTKFVTTVDKLCEFLRMAKDEYYCQEMNRNRLLPYHTIYLDTPHLIMFREHQRGKKHRYKVRMRMYETNDVAFLEVKNKNNHGRTKKKRIEIDCLQYGDEEQKEFVEEKTPYCADYLIPVIENRFQRITLVNKDKTERLTIDMGLWFHNLHNGKVKQLPEHVIIELKREGLAESPAIDLLRKLRIKPLGFSKMALGLAMTDPSLKQNNLKQRIRMIEKLSTPLTPDNP